MKVLVTCAGSAPAVAVIKALKPHCEVYATDLKDKVAAYHLVKKWNNEKVDFVFPILDPGKWENEITNNLWTRETAGDKWRTYYHCLDNSILVPKSFPKVLSKPDKGMGSKGINIYEGLIQEYIPGFEYTVDIVATPKGKILQAIPKLRMKIKDGQAVKSATVHYPQLQKHAMRVAKIFRIDGAANIQFIENEDGFYLIEVNAKYSASLPLTTEAGINIPWLHIKMRTGQKISKEDLNYKEVLMMRYWEEVYEPYTNYRVGGWL